MELIIDSRENKILEQLEAFSSYKYKKEYLDLGDFVLSDSNGHTLFFERKTWADLAGSLKDGRYREQRSRLLEQRDSSAAETSKVCYIIEGVYQEEYKSEKHAVTRLQFVYNVPVMFSQSVMNTIEILQCFLEKENLNAFFTEGRDPLLDQIEARSNGKKKNYDDARLFFGECLATIKGISGPMALAIAGKWSTLNDFIKDSDWERTLKEEINYKTAKGNDKHISDKVIDKIRALTSYMIDFPYYCGESIFGDSDCSSDSESTYYDEHRDFSIEETICKDKNYVTVRKMLEEGNTFSLNKIIGISCKNGQLEMLRYIFEYDVNLKLEGYNFDPYCGDEMCALETACFYCNLDIVNYLLSHGMESNHINKSLEICMDYVDDWNFAILLLENGGDVNVENHECLTLLSKACESANYEMVQCLCEKYSAKPDAYNILSCVNNKQNIDEYTKIAEFLIRKLDIDYFYNHSDEFSDFFYCSNPDNFRDITRFKMDNRYKKVMDMILNEEKRRNICSLLLISYKRRQDLHEDLLRHISSFF